MKIKLKQLDSEAVKAFTETEVGTLLEDIDSKLDLILESQKSMANDIKDMSKDYNKLDNRVERTEIRLDVIETR